MTEAESAPTPASGTETPSFPNPESMPDVETAFGEIEVDSPLVGIIMGSANDKPKMQPAGKALEEAALPGVAAAHPSLPGIGVPIAGKNLGGMDALLAIAQMPPGVPVACMAVDGAKNAGLYAARIIGL